MSRAGRTSEGRWVTIGVPTFNSGTHLNDALNSIRRQSYGHFRVLVVDDGSDDGSFQDAAREFATDRRFEFVADGQRRGLSRRLNQISEMAETEFLFRMDADDLMVPERIDRQLKRLRDADRPDLVASDMWVMNAEGWVYGRRNCFSEVPLDSREVLLRLTGLPHPTVCGRTSWFMENPYSEALRRTEDLELWIRSLDSTTYGVVEEPLLMYRQPAKVDPVKYRIAMAETRSIIRKYGPAKIGRWRTGRQIGYTVAKEAVVLLAHTLNVDAQIIKRRSLPLSAVEASIVNSNVRRMLDPKVGSDELIVT